MTSSEFQQDYQTLSHRLGALELKLKRQRAILFSVIAGTALVLFLGVSFLAFPAGGLSRTSKQIEAERIVLRDSKGNVKISLDSKERSGISLYDDQGKVMAGIAGQGGSSFLFLNDATGTQRAVLSVFKDGFGLGLNDPQGKERISLKFTEEGPLLQLREPGGKSQAVLALSSQGPHILLGDARGIHQMELGVAAAGPRIVLRDEKGNARLGLSVTQKQGARVGIIDENGKMIYYKP